MSYSLPNTDFTIRKQPNVMIELHINEQLINNNIMEILYSCELFAFGYNVENNLFWGKKMKNNKLQFHFIMKIKCCGIEMTNIELYVINDDKYNTNTKLITIGLINLFKKI